MPVKAARARSAPERQQPAAAVDGDAGVDLVVIPAATPIERAQDAAARAQVVAILRRLLRGAVR